MNTIHHSQAGRRGRLAATTLLVAAGATVAAVLGAAAPAQAAPDTYVAVSLGYLNNGSTVVGGIGTGPDQDQARIASLNKCVDNGGAHCVTEAAADNACVAGVTDLNGDLNGASGATLSEAQSNAKSKLQGAKVVASGCSNGPNRPPVGVNPVVPVGPVKPVEPPPAPKLGPTVSFHPILGGLEADITDRSGVSSQCTYATDNYNRGFALPANSTYDLKIVPAIPEFRNWTVTITCDNGTSTTVTTYF